MGNRRQKKRPKNRSKKTRTSTTDPVTQHARDVLSGKIIAGPHVRDACQRHLTDLKEGSKRGLRWDLEAARHTIGFFRDVLKLNGGDFEGDPFILLPWQAFVVGSLFGWKRKDGFRRFRIAYIEAGKGSGKTPLAAGVGLYMQTADKEARAEIYAAAYKKDQAKVLFRDAVAMVELSPALTRRMLMSGQVEKFNIAHLASGSFFRPIASEDRGRGQSGPRPHCATLDEIHEHPTNAMVEFMRAGTKGRRQPLVLMITNAGFDRESVCYDYHDYAVKVARGALQDDSFFGYVCALDENEDPFKSKKCWIKSNPSLPVIPGIKYLEEQVREARGIPSKRNLVLRLNFCVWTDAESTWIKKEAWESCETILDLERYRGRRCFAALDLSGKLDLTALALAFLNEDDGSVDAFLEFWTPADTLRARVERDRVPYDVWKREGHLVAVPGKTIDYEYVARRLGELNAMFDIISIDYDRWRIEDLQRELEAEGLELPLVECGQGFKDMNPAVEATEDVILNGKLNVHTNPVLRWNVASAVLEEDPAGNRKFTKRRATGRIDGIVALAMAIRRALQPHDEGLGHVTEGILVV